MSENQTSTLRRIMNEIKQIKANMKTNSSMFTLQQIKDDMYNWRAVIFGPAETLYSGYKWELNIVLPNDYPTSPIKIKFMTPIEHVNVNSDGDICMDILKKEWTPTQNMETILISLISLLSSPNIVDPLNSDLAELYRSNPKKYEATIKNACAKKAIRM